MNSLKSLSPNPSQRNLTPEEKNRYGIALTPEEVQELLDVARGYEEAIDQAYEEGYQHGLDAAEREVA